MSNLLENINSPADVKKLSVPQLVELAEEIRQFILKSVSKTGGHLASNLGVVELTLALHCVFDFQTDKLLWDVGHQCYTHKIITSSSRICGMSMVSAAFQIPRKVRSTSLWSVMRELLSQPLSEWQSGSN